MSIEKYNGIVFKSIPYSETSFILDIYTRSKGLNSYIVSGVRKRKSKSNAGLYKPMTLINFVAYFGTAQKLYRIKEAKYDKIYQSITTDVIKSTMAMFMIDLCRHSIKEKEPNFELFDFIKNRFLILDEVKNIPADYHLSFALHLCNYLGFYPQDNWDENERPYFDLVKGVFINDPTTVRLHLGVEESEYLYSLIDQNKELYAPTRELRNKLLDSLMLYYHEHVDGFKQLPSLEVFRTIFAN